MGSRDLVLVIWSAQGLRNEHNLHQVRKLKPFALVSIRDNNNNLCSSEEPTRVDSDGNTNPNWNFHVTFSIDIARVVDNHLALVVKLKSRRKSGDKDIGEVRVPIAELEGFGDADAVAERHLNRDVLNLDGTPQQGGGSLNFSYRFGPFGDTVQQDQHPPASTANIGNYATQNAQQRPGTARRFAERFTGTLGSAVGYTTGNLAATAAFTSFTGGGQSSGGPPVTDQNPDDDTADFGNGQDY